MIKFIKKLYFKQADSLSDLALTCLLWLMTFVALPYSIISYLRRFKFSYQMQVLIGVLIFIIVSGIVLIKLNQDYLSDYQHKRGFFSKRK